MGFSIGQHVEVASKVDGFVGSYFEATIVTKITLRKFYLVQYKTLVTDDFSEPLEEIVSFPELRPLPPLITVPVPGFGKFDRVDVFENEGWWVGTVVGIFEGQYYVFFETTGELQPFGIDRLRVHQDWINRKWHVAGKNIVDQFR